jgi:hypothetical protein
MNPQQEHSESDPGNSQECQQAQPEDQETPEAPEAQQETQPEWDGTYGGLRYFLERPALLIGEVEQAYEDLLDEVHLETKPEDLFDRLNALDITNSIWEAQRLRMLAADFVTNARVTALTLLLGPFLNEDHNAAIDCAQAIYGGDKKHKAEALKVVRRYKITDAQINAQAYLINNVPITVLDRGIINRENLRRSLVKEHKRKLKKAEKAKRQQKQAPATSPVAPSESETMATKSVQPSPATTINDNEVASPTPDFPKRNLKRRVEV